LPASDTNNLFIFAGGPSNYSNAINVKIYSLDIIEDNILKRALRPCLRISDKKPGMYDLANDIFYINQGSGEFVYGS